MPILKEQIYRAKEVIRTPGLYFGKVMLYQLSYFRIINTHTYEYL